MTDDFTGIHQSTTDTAIEYGNEYEAPRTYGFETPQAHTGPRYVNSGHGVRGFARQPSSATGAPAKPQPKRPKGQLLTGTLLLAVIIAGFHTAWRVFIHLDTYGVVSGRVVGISSQWDGTVQRWHVQEGDVVSQGQLLLTLHSPDLERRLAHFRDELRLAKADLVAGAYELEWRSREQTNLSQQALAEYYQKWATLMEERAELAGLESKNQRLKILREGGHASVIELEQMSHTLDGQRGKVEKITTAVQELQKRAQLVANGDVEAAQRLQPKLARLEVLQNALSRLREETSQGQVFAPVGGRILRKHCYTGETAKTSDTLLEILEDGSLEVSLYFTQQAARKACVGQHVDIEIVPYPQLFSARITRIDNDLQQAPEGVQRFYPTGEKLFVAHATLELAQNPASQLPLGARVRLANRGPIATTFMPSALASSSDLDSPQPIHPPDVAIQLPSYHHEE